MIQGYSRKPTKFDWCGTTVWLMKLTKAQREAVFADGNEAMFVDLILLCLTDEQGTPLYTSREQVVGYFDTNVAEDDWATLAKLVLKHSGLEGDTQKKS